MYDNISKHLYSHVQQGQLGWRFHKCLNLSSQHSKRRGFGLESALSQNISIFENSRLVFDNMASTNM